MNKKRLGSNVCLFTTIIMLLSQVGCGNSPVGKEVKKYSCQVSGYEITDPRATMRKVAEERHAVRLKMGSDYEKFLLYPNGVYQTAFVYDGNEIHERYGQYYSFATREWTVQPEFNVEVDNVVYDSVFNIFAGLDGNLYGMISGEDDVWKLAVLNSAGEATKVIELPEELLKRLKALDNDQLFCDKAGNIYYSNLELDPAGGAVSRVSAYDTDLRKKWDREYKGRIFGIMQADASSEVVWYGTDSTGRSAMWHENGKEFPEGDPQEMPGGYALAAYAADGACYFLDSQALWLRKDKGYEKVYDLAADGYRLDLLYGMTADEDGGIQALLRIYDEITLMEFTFDETSAPEEKQEITLAYCMQNVALNRVIARYNMQSQKYHIRVVLPEDGEDRWSFPQRIQMELSAGRGPDMLGDDVVYDPATMAQKGYLECLDSYAIDSEECIAAVFEDSQFFGRQYGIPYDFALNYVAYRRNDVNADEPFTLEELMECVRSKEVKILQEDFYGKDIVLRYALEDLAPYFAGEKTAEQAAEILNNRVQLYLDEQNMSR